MKKQMLDSRRFPKMNLDLQRLLQVFQFNPWFDTSLKTFYVGVHVFASIIYGKHNT